MKIMTLNVGIWTRNWSKTDAHWWLPRARAMKRMLLSEQPDIICFQELWFPHNLFVPRCYKKVLGTGWEHPVYIRRGMKAQRSRFTLYWSLASVGGTDIFCIHSSLKSRTAQRTFRQLREMYLYSGRPTIIAGDFNNSWRRVSALLPELETARGRNKIRDTFVNFTRPESHGEIDHIAFHGREVGGFRIIGGEQMFTISDHCPVVAEF